MRKAKIIFILSLIFTVLYLAVQADAAPFYDGKTITIIVSTKAGGGYDLYARLVGKYMEKYLPGSTIIIKNMPGAGHVIGCNAVYMAKPDGLTFGTFNRALGLSQVVGTEGVRFDWAKMGWIGIASTEIFSFIVSNKIKNMDDVIKADRVRLVSEGIGAINYLGPKLVAYMLGTDNFSIGTGFGGSEFQLAIMRNEADGAFGSWTSWEPFVKEGNGHPVMFIGTGRPDGYEKIYENVPMVQDIVKDKKHQPIIDLMIAINTMGRPFAGPPGIPEDRLQILREAFEKACNDPEMIEMSEKAGRPINFVGWEQTEKYAKDILNIPPDVLKVVKEGFGMNQ